MKNKLLLLLLLAVTTTGSVGFAHADGGFDSVTDVNNFKAAGTTVMTLTGSSKYASFMGDASFAGSIHSTGTITSPQGFVSLRYGSSFIANAWDAVYGSIDNETNKYYDLIGTYHGWDKDSVYIAGYNAADTNARASAKSISFGGWGTGSFTTALVDLINHRVGIGTTTPQSTLDVNGEVKIGGTGVSCSSANEGAQRYNQSLHAMEYCNGSAWTNMSSGLTMVPPRALLCSSSERDWTQLSLPEIPSSARYALIGYWYVIDGPDRVGISLIRGRADASSSDYVITGGRCAASADSCGGGGQSYIPFNQANHSIDVAVDSYSWNGEYCLYIYGYSN